MTNWLYDKSAVIAAYLFMPIVLVALLAMAVVDYAPLLWRRK